MVRIFADSTCDLSPELIARYNISIIPLYVVLGEDEYLDGVNITADEIFKWSDEHNTTPKTAAPSIQTAIDSFEKAISAGDEIVAFSISEKMSTTANVFRMAADELDAAERISVVDSANLSTGIGLLVIEAAIKAQEGKSREEIVKYIEELRPLVRASFVIDTLTYLHRGGRCTGVAALAGAVLGIHPQIDVVDGAMQPGRKFRGRIESVIEKYMMSLEEDLLKARPDRVFITHSPVSQETEDAVRKYLESLGYFKEILATDAGGVICSHCGPGTLGVLFISS